MRSVLVRVVDSGGRPVSNARVAIGVYQSFSAGGVLPDKYTDSNGEAEFDVDEYDAVNVYVNGTEKIGRSPIQGTFRVQM